MEAGRFWATLLEVIDSAPQDWFGFVPTKDARHGDFTNASAMKVMAEVMRRLAEE